MERTLGPRRSSCLRLQLFRVEMCSFLPDDESDRRYLSRQGEASHRRLHAFGEQSLVEIVERSLPAAGHRRRTLEDGFHIVIMILIEPTNLLGLLRTLQLSAHVTVLRAVARIARQSAVGAGIREPPIIREGLFQVFGFQRRAQLSANRQRQ